MKTTTTIKNKQKKEIGTRLRAFTLYTHTFLPPSRKNEEKKESVMPSLAVGGLIGSGKTTFLKLLGHELDPNIFYTVLEAVDEWRSKLEDFYAGKPGSRQILQDTIMNHYLSTSNGAREGTIALVERCAAEAYFVFCDDRDFSEETMAAYLELAHQTRPDVYFHMRCTPDRALEQIRARERDANGGDAEITLEYLKALDGRYAALIDWLVKSGTQVVSVFGEQAEDGSYISYRLEDCRGNPVPATRAFCHPVDFAKEGELAEFSLAR